MTKRAPPGDHPGHQMGKRCGYDVEPDGRIRPAPTYADEFAMYSRQRHGINDLMKMFTSHSADMLAQIERHEQRLWKNVMEDYGLNKETHEIFFDGEYITLKPRVKEQAPESSGMGKTGEPHG